MRKLLAATHVFTLLLGLTLALYVVYVASENHQHKELQALGRTTIGLALILFTIAHAYILKRYGAFIHAFLTYPIIYITFALIAEYSWLGYYKNWAPASEAQANIANIKWLIIILLIVITAIISVIWRPKKPL